MHSIQEFGLDTFIPSDCQRRYENIVNSSLPLAEKIVELLTINPGFILSDDGNQDEVLYKKRTRRRSIRIISEKIERNEKIEFFALSFNAKPQTKAITNGLVYPDALDFIAILHLNLVFKHINNLYPPGVILRIGSECNYFHKFSGITQDEAMDIYDTHHQFNHIAEQMVNSFDKILIYDVFSEVEHNKKEFYLRIEDAKYTILQEDEHMADIKNSAKYYLNYVVDIEHFPNEEAAMNFCLYHSLEAAAYKKVITSQMFETDSGLFERFNSLIWVETRFQSGSIYEDKRDSVFISFLPGASTFFFNRLAYRTNEDLWKLITYKEVLQNQYSEVFVKELKQPFYFEGRE